MCTLRLTTGWRVFTRPEEALVALLCVHASIAIENVTLRSQQHVLQRVRALVGQPQMGSVGNGTVREVGDPRLDLVRHEAFVGGASNRRLGSLAKRFFDVVVALALLVALTPVIVVVALAIKLDSRGPIFYRCRRVGVGGRVFDMLKFRKMHRDAEGPALTSVHDERFSRVGAFLARTKLDELPQLLNVIRGQMSLVGPRPEDPVFVALEPLQYTEILRVRPGITGLSQLAFAREGRILDGPDRLERYVNRLFPQKVAMDRLYVAQRTMLLDVRILFWTFVTLFGIEIAVDRRGAALSLRRRPNAHPVPPAASTEST